MNNLLVIFSHGQESSPWSSKITYLADIAKKHNAEVLSPDYSGMSDPNDRVAHLLSLPEITNRQYDQIILVGSSMGSYVACVASQSIKPLGMFLLAPAFGITEYPSQYPAPGCQNVEIVMGWQDEVIPVDNVIKFAAKYLSRLHLFNADHRLKTVIPEIGVLFDNFLTVVPKCIKS